MSSQVNFLVPSNGEVNTSLKSVGKFGALGIVVVVVDDVVVDEVVVEDLVVVGKSETSSHTEPDLVVPYSLTRSTEKHNGTDPFLRYSNL